MKDEEMFYALGPKGTLQTCSGGRVYVTNPSPSSEAAWPGAAMKTCRLFFDILLLVPSLAVTFTQVHRAAHRLLSVPGLLWHIPSRAAASVSAHFG